MTITLILGDTVPHEPQQPAVTAQTQLGLAQWRQMTAVQQAQEVARLELRVKNDIVARQPLAGAIRRTDGKLWIRRP